MTQTVIKMSSIIFMLLCGLTLTSSNYFRSNSEVNDQCFCKLKGSIDDCTCNVDTVDYFNNVRIHPRLQSLLVRDYFRFYKVNLMNPCPFWADDSKCAFRHCHVLPCHDDIPIGLKGEIPRHLHKTEAPFDKYLAENQLINCEQTAKDHNRELGYLNTTISSENYKEFERWQQHDDAQDNFCVRETTPGEYVDLLLNPEKFTGYKGPSAHRIWRSIYMENCFRPDMGPQNFIHSSQMNGMCLEKRAFYRVVSGLHASINIHLCSKYLLSHQDQTLSLVSGPTEWGPNLEEFQKRFSPEWTGDEGPNWLKNLYFIYLLELRALDKASPYLEKEEYYTGDDAADEETRSAVKDMLQIVRSFPDHYNESCMFNGGSEAATLKEEFRQHFRNISRIMDCVGCDKCKLWGKLQIHGLGTALKILFSGKFDQWETSMNNISRKQFYLERSEIVALINAFGRLSESIFELERYRQMMR
ncbi:ero1-like protein isoform X2 [Fopius arisanus]|uniref:Ero1-like protein isoform X2 n=1 Tax=Fopius arisanus TaxID=64838 RepID=A0A9R1TAJ2_9HYME|nr:PREDICTED: ero1-like protein isoform X2 [Fopius arisanus]